jgi:pimeloyl-ACP methyl ester carboxylesterase
VDYICVGLTYMSQKIRATAQYVQVAGQRVRYLVAGAGDPLVLVHGLSASTHWWVRNLPELARHYRVYLVDLPGFGTMHFPYSRFVLANAASWLVSWMEAVGLKRAHLIGHSMGGYICMQIAAHFPEKVFRLVLVAPAVRPQARTVAGYFLPLLIGLRYATPSFLPILLFDALRAGPFTLLQTTRDLVALDVQEEMQAISAPTLLIWGENDTLVPPSMASVLHKEIAHSSLIMLKRAGHVCMYDCYHDFNTATLIFLRG